MNKNNRCSARVFSSNGSFTGHMCSRRATCEEDGNGWCSQHDLRQRCEDLGLIVLTSESQSAWIVERAYSGQWRLKFYSDEPNKDSSVDLACDARGLPVLTNEARKALGGDE